MQNAKDSFYIALRNRMATLDPGRVMTLRGVQRPSVLVEEAESPEAQIPSDVFVLRWTSVSAMQELPTPLVVLSCEVHYATAGSQGNAGLDRGRTLSGMDSLLNAMLRPQATQKCNYTSNPALMMLTQVFWGDAVFEPQQTVRDRVLRVVKIAVLSFQEAGEQ
jgi:hypothetical protein